jgi:hypothetical protein
MKDLKTHFDPDCEAINNFMGLAKPGPISKLALEELLKGRSKEIAAHKLIEKCIEVAEKCGNNENNGLREEENAYVFSCASFHLYSYEVLGDRRIIARDSHSASMPFFEATKVKEKEGIYPFVQTEFGLFKISHYRPEEGNWMQQLDNSYAKMNQDVSFERAAVVMQNFGLK